MASPPFLLGAFALPDDPVWTDESGWCPVAKSVSRGITGSLIVHISVKQEGRPITLKIGWPTRDQLAAIAAMAADPTAKYTLTIPQGEYLVEFCDPPYTVTALREISDPGDDEKSEVTLNLMTTAVD